MILLTKLPYRSQRVTYTSTSGSLIFQKATTRLVREATALSAPVTESTSTAWSTSSPWLEL